MQGLISCKFSSNIQQLSVLYFRFHSIEFLEYQKNDDVMTNSEKNAIHFFYAREKN